MRIEALMKARRGPFNRKAYRVAGEATTKAKRKAALSQFTVLDEVEKKVAVVFAAGDACVISIGRTYYTFKLAKSDDVTHNLIILGFWTHAEITVGIMISCFPVLPRLFQFWNSRLHNTFSRFQSSGMTGSETSGPRFIRTSVQRMRGKKSSDGFIDLYDTESSDKQSPFQQGQELKQQDLGANSLLSTRDGDGDDSAPPGDDLYDEQARGQIRMTTRIETKSGPHVTATHVPHQFRW